MFRQIGLIALPGLWLVCAAGPALSQDALTNFPSAKVVIGQTDFTGGECDQNANPSATDLCGPEGPGALGKKFLYVSDADNNRVLGYSKVPNMNDPSAKLVLGQPDFTSSGSGTSRTSFEFPTAVATAGKKLFVAEFDNSRVLIWNKLPTKTNTPASVVVGQPNFTSKTATTTQSGLDLPESGLFVTHGKLLVADRNNNRVMIWNKIPTTNGKNADVVVGQADFSSRVADATQTNLNEPEGIWSDGTRLVVADFMNNRVMIWNTFPTTNGAPADVVVGQPNFTSFDSPEPPTAQSLDEPGGVASDGTRLFVADSRNNRILVFNAFPTSNNPTADVVIGEPDFVHSDGNGGSLTPTAQGLSFPFGLTIIGSQLLVNDNGNSRYLIFSTQ